MNYACGLFLWRGGMRIHPGDAPVMIGSIISSLTLSSVHLYQANIKVAEVGVLPRVLKNPVYGTTPMRR